MKTKSMEVLGIIGARSGSKGLPNKNILPLAGKPLMAWIIEAALKSRYLTRVIVSTDSREYATIARQHGAQVPFLRPAEFASDDSPEYQYVKYTVEWLEKNESYKPELVVRLLPTVPLQTSEDIDGCIDALLMDIKAQSAVAIAEARQHPEKALKLIEDGKGGHLLVTYLTGSGRDVTPIGRQSYQKAFFRANLIVSRTDVIKNGGSLTGDRVRYYIIPQERAIDIDSQMDFFIAEQIIMKYFK